VQASSLEIVRRGAALENNSIAGARVMAFALPALESLDINTEHDWIVLEHLVKNSPDVLPRIGE
jgi:CMP-N-acetylneuraminic acid synthetase